MFVKGPRSDTPEDALLVQFQGMIAEYERAQIIERTRRGKTHRARQGTVNVLSGAPFGYRYVRKNEHADARYEVVAHEAAIVTELFRRYVEDGVAIAELARWLTATGVATRTGKSRWDRSVIWGMLRNPAYAGRACFGKTMRTRDQPGLNRTARLAGRATPTSTRSPTATAHDWLEIPVPALVTEDTWQRAQRRLADNKRFAARNSKVPSLLQGLAACSSCGYAYYRGHTTTTAGNKIYYYRCLGSDNYRYQHGRVCDNKPVRTDYLDNSSGTTSPACSPTRADPRRDRPRLDQLRTADPTTARSSASSRHWPRPPPRQPADQRLPGRADLPRRARERTPELRSRETSLRGQLDALAAQLVDREAYLKLADRLEDFLARLRGNAATATVPEQQRVLRLLVKDVLIGPERILIRHSIPTASGARPQPQVTDGDTDEEPAPSSPLRWRSLLTAAGQHLPARLRPGDGTGHPGVGRWCGMPTTSWSCAGPRTRRRRPWRRPAGSGVDGVGAASGQDEDRRSSGRPGGFRLSWMSLQARMSGRMWEQKRMVRYYLHRWPSQRAMKRLREKVRDRTGASRKGTRIEWMIEDLNPILRGWGNYFRTGNAATKFRQIDRYVVWRLKRLQIKKRGRTCTPGWPISGPRTGSTELGLYRLRGTIRYPKAA